MVRLLFITPRSFDVIFSDSVVLDSNFDPNSDHYSLCRVVVVDILEEIVEKCVSE